MPDVNDNLVTDEWNEGPVTDVYDPEEARQQLNELKAKLDDHSEMVESARVVGLRNIALDLAVRISPPTVAATKLVAEAQIIECYLTTGQVPTIKLSRQSSSSVDTYGGVYHKQPLPDEEPPVSGFPGETLITGRSMPGGHHPFCQGDLTQPHGNQCFPLDTIPGRSGG